MVRRLVGAAAIAVAALNVLAVTTVSAADDICSVEIAKCYIDAGKKTCDRENAVCPPCLAEMDSGILGIFTSTKYACYQLNDDSECPENSTSCPATTPSPSPTPTPTPKKTPKKTPAKSSSGSGSSDSSSSGSSTPKPSKTKKASSSSSGSSSSSNVKTPKPTPSPTPKPTPSPTPTPTPSPTPTPTTASPQVSQASSPTNANAANDDSSSGSSLGLILAIAGGGVVVVAVLAFFVWKRRQDDDDDSDDEESRYPPKSNYNHAATSTAYAAGAAPTAFSKPVAAAPYASNPQPVPGQMVTSPGNNNHTYAIPVAGPIVDYDSPSNVDRSQRSFYVDAPSQGGGGGGGGFRLSDPESHSSSEGGRDVWGNTVGSYREKRTNSNVSVEF